MVSDLTIVKLGGSVITYKDKVPPKTDIDALDRIAQELRACRGPLIVVLGGGAHGHQAAKHYGYDTPEGMERRLEGVPLIRHNMTLLCQDVQDSLARAGISTVSIPPFCTFVLNAEKIDEYFIEPIVMSLESGLTVVTHGDVCFDRSHGASILSGDTLVSWLSAQLGAPRVLVGTDVDGIYDSDPRMNPDAKLVRRVDNSNELFVLDGLGPSASIDVTGGMLKKVRELIEAAQHGATVTIFNLSVEGRLEALLRGEETICTRIAFNH